ncbi:methionine/alanine import family NSS transporter small subunit [Blastococcus sp. MG754427]|nr:methionine/alanine import family NSS transporter small subunit [Blastococcus sp. MG754427]
MARRDPPGRPATGLRPRSTPGGGDAPRPLGQRLRRGRPAVSASAIVMMVVAMLIIWGGLALAVTSLVRHGAVEQRAENVRRDL